MPQTPQQAEIERLRDALFEIDELTGFEWATMPETGRAKAHELTRQIVLRAINGQNDELTRRGNKAEPKAKHDQ